MENDSPLHRREEMYVVLDESLPVIHAALLAYYGFEEEEAQAFEDTLCLWFHRVGRRTGIRGLPPRDLREQLLFVACKYARAFQIARSNNGTHPAADSVLSIRDPEDVAIELLGRIPQQGIHQ
jgi:hypothetical protein